MIKTTLTTFEAAKMLGHFSGWKVSNLAMHKILYLAHMFYMGRREDHSLLIVGEKFEAWKYGPVLPTLYHHVKFFGKDPVTDVFYSNNIVEEGPAADMIKEASEALAHAKPGVLVMNTHKPGGAWDKNYKRREKSIVIPDQDILKEYKDFYAKRK